MGIKIERPVSWGIMEVEGWGGASSLRRGLDEMVKPATRARAGALRLLPT